MKQDHWRCNPKNFQLGISVSYDRLSGCLDHCCHEHLYHSWGPTPIREGKGRHLSIKDWLCKQYLSQAPTVFTTVAPLTCGGESFLATRFISLDLTTGPVSVRIRQGGDDCGSKNQLLMSQWHKHATTAATGCVRLVWFQCFSLKEPKRAHGCGPAVAQPSFVASHLSFCLFGNKYQTSYVPCLHKKSPNENSPGLGR